MTKRRYQGLDLEFVLLMPILLLLLAANIHKLVQDVSSVEVSATELAHQLLATCFYVLLVVLMVIRRPAKRTSGSRVAIFAAYAGTFLPFALIANRADPLEAGVLAFTSLTVMLIGLAFSVYALGWLGRSFGVIPAARRLVRHGPYGIVRHPLYAAEIITFGGVVLGELTLFSFLVLVAVVAVQAYRALQEEKLLRQVFPEYDEYSRKTRRFIPGVI